MKIILFFMMSIRFSYCDVVEKSFYNGDQRFSVKIQGEDLIKMVAIDPLDPETVGYRVSDLALLVKDEVDAFKKRYAIKNLHLQRVALVRFYTFDDGRKVWLWEVSFSFANESNPINEISFFVTHKGEILSPKKRPYGKQ